MLASAFIAKGMTLGYASTLKEKPKNKEEKKIDELLQNLKAANSQIFDLKKRVKDAEAFIKAQEFDHFCMALFYRDDFLWAAGEDKKYPFYRFVDVSDAVKGNTSLHKFDRFMLSTYYHLVNE